MSANNTGKSPAACALIGAIATTLLLLSSIALNQQSATPSLDTWACENCHLGGADTNATNASMLINSQIELCRHCHQNAIQASHPSEIQPSMPLPANYPADWKGDLTCSSCHQIHHDEHGRLRTDVRGRKFCTACHADSFFERMSDGGLSLMQSGHLDAGSSYEELGIDPFSAQCLGCHVDKGEGADYSVRVNTNRLIRHRSGTNHPVGGNYVDASRFGGYRPIERLPETILLPGGVVSCVSCHLGYSSDHGAVVTKLHGSDLCFQCHDL